MKKKKSKMSSEHGTQTASGTIPRTDAEHAAAFYRSAVVAASPYYMARFVNQFGTKFFERYFRAKGWLWPDVDAGRAWILTDELLDLLIMMLVPGGFLEVVEADAERSTVPD